MSKEHQDLEILSHTTMEKYFQLPIDLIIVIRVVFIRMEELDGGTVVVAGIAI